MAVERVLTQRELNRALLARQLLLKRARLSIPKALERIGGLQAQYAPSMYIGLWSRLDGFERDALTRALERRSVIQATMMRATIHLVSKADFWPLLIAIRDERLKWWERVHPASDPGEMRAAAKRLRRFIGEGPRRRKEVEELLAGRPRSGSGPTSTSSACRLRAPGSSVAPTCTPSPRTGFLPRASSATRPSTI